MKKISVIFLLLAGLTAGAQQTKAPQTLRGVLLEQFRDTWTEEDWFVPVMKSLDGVTAKQAAWKPAELGAFDRRTGLPYLVLEQRAAGQVQWPQTGPILR